MNRDHADDATDGCSRLTSASARRLRATVPAMLAWEPRRRARSEPPPVETPYVAWLRAVTSGSAYDERTGRLVAPVRGPDGRIVDADPMPHMGPRGRLVEIARSIRRARARRRSGA